MNKPTTGSSAELSMPIELPSHGERTRSARLSLPTYVLLLPWAFAAIVVAMTAVNVPIHDQWELVPLIEKMRAGELSFADFWTQHNEHRIVVSKALHLGLASLTHWDVRFESALNLLVSIAGFPVLLALLRRLLDSFAIRRRAPFEIVASLAYFSLVQWENYAWGFQTGWIIVIASLLIVLLNLSKAGDDHARRGGPIAIALAFATLGSFSIAGGLLIWPAAVIVFIAHPRMRRLLPLWLFVAAIVWIGYFAGSSVETATSYDVDGSLGGKALYVFAYLGRALVPDSGRIVATAAVAVGALLCLWFGVIALVAWRSFKSHRPVLSVWIALGAFALLSAAATASGRSGYGIEQALSSRYTTNSVLLVLSVSVLSMIVFRRLEITRLVRRLAVSAAMLGLCLYATTSAWGVARLVARQERLQIAKSCLDLGIVECHPDVYPYERVLLNRTKYLKSIGWGGF